MSAVAPVYRDETTEDIARQALRAAEWYETIEFDSARIGMDVTVPYCVFRCPVCRGFRSDSAQMNRNGHCFWCPVAEALKALGEEPEQEDAPEEYGPFVARFKRRLDAGEDTAKVAYDIVHDAHQSFDHEAIRVKIFRDLGLRRIEVAQA